LQTETTPTDSKAETKPSGPEAALVARFENGLLAVLARLAAAAERIADTGERLADAAESLDETLRGFGDYSWDNEKRRYHEIISDEHLRPRFDKEETKEEQEGTFKNP